MIRAAGFRRASFEPLTGGVVALHPAAAVTAAVT
jgi:hypothetical protein